MSCKKCYQLAAASIVAGCAVSPALAVSDDYSSSQLNTSYTFVSTTLGGTQEGATGAAGGTAETPNVASFDIATSNSFLTLKANNSPLTLGNGGVVSIAAIANLGPTGDAVVSALVNVGPKNGIASTSTNSDVGVLAREGTGGAYVANLDLSRGVLDLARQNANGTITNLGPIIGGGASGVNLNGTFDPNEDYFVQLKVTGVSATGISLVASVYDDATLSNLRVQITATDSPGAAFDTGVTGMFVAFNNDSSVSNRNAAFGTFDNFSSTVPEPTAIGLAGAGLLLLGRRARRR